MAKKKNKTQSTQQHLTIQEIRDGIVVMKDGGLRAILMVNSINFALKSEDEQQALLYAYQNFLNSLIFPIQIVVQSRKLDLGNYIKKLEALEREQTNDLLRLQTREHVRFIRSLLSAVNIMSKFFYVVIPYHSRGVGVAKKKFWDSFLNLFNPSRAQKPAGRFEALKTELMERVSLVSNGLASLGLDNVQLNSQEIAELLYTTYNSDTAYRQKLFSISNLRADVVKKLEEEKESA